MLRLRTPAVLAGVVVAAFFTLGCPAFGASAPRTITHSLDTARVEWLYTNPQGKQVWVAAHQCEEREYEGGDNGLARSFRHLRVSLQDAPPGERYVCSAEFEIPGSSLSLGEDPRTARIHGSGIGAYREFVAGVCTERPARFALDLRIRGTGAVTVRTSSWLEGPWPDGLWRDCLSTWFSRGGTYSGFVTMDGNSIAGPAGSESVQLTHNHTSYTVIEAPE